MIYRRNTEDNSGSMPNPKKAKQYSDFVKEFIKKNITKINKETGKAINDGFTTKFYFISNGKFFNLIPSQEEFRKISHISCEGIIDLASKDEFANVSAKLKKILPSEFEIINLPYKSISVYVPMSWIKDNIK